MAVTLRLKFSGLNYGNGQLCVFIVISGGSRRVRYHLFVLGAALGGKEGKYGSLIGDLESDLDGQKCLVGVLGIFLEETGEHLEIPGAKIVGVEFACLMSDRHYVMVHGAHRC